MKTTSGRLNPTFIRLQRLFSWAQSLQHLFAVCWAGWTLSERKSAEGTYFSGDEAHAAQPVRSSGAAEEVGAFFVS